MQVQIPFGFDRHPAAAVFLFLILLLSTPLIHSGQVARSFNSYEENVLSVYLAYYGRPADPGGLAFWADRLEQEGGALDAIIGAFGVSEEYQQRFGALSNTELVNNLYQQLFGRDPDPGGRDYYVGELDSGELNLQKISLDILYGAQNDDLTIIANRIEFAKYYVSNAEVGEIDDQTADQQAALVATIGADTATLNQAYISLDGGIEAEAYVSFALSDGVYRIAARDGAVAENISLLLENIAPGGEDGSLNISPNGEWLVLDSGRFENECIGWACLTVVSGDLINGEVIKVDGSVLRADAPDHVMSAISNDGGSVIFPSSGGPHDSDLFITSKLSENSWSLPLLLTGDSPYDYNALPAISAAGDTVVFDCGPTPYGQEGTNICEVATDGSNFMLLIATSNSPAGLPEANSLHHPDYAMDGSIVFEGDWNGERIWRLYPSSGTLSQIGEFNNDNSPCVLPSGNIASLTFGGDTNNHLIKIMDANGSQHSILFEEQDVVDIGIGCGGPTQVSGTVRDDGAYRLNIDLSGSLQNPAFSPDGRSIVFTRFRNGYNTGPADLFTYSLETGELKTLMSDGHDNINLPGSAWNETINSVVFSSTVGYHDEIFLISATGTTGDDVQLTNRENKQSFEPTFSPDAQWIVFESHDIDVEGAGVITKYKVDGTSEYIELTASSDDSRQPNWSPAGDKILYQKQENGMWAIWTMDVNGENNAAITSANESATDASFSSDGAWVIYSSENADVENANIYRVPADGGESIRITIDEGYDGATSISPDGTMVAFESIDGDPDQSAGTTIWIIDIGQ